VSVNFRDRGIPGVVLFADHGGAHGNGFGHRRYAGGTARPKRVGSVWPVHTVLSASPSRAGLPRALARLRTFADFYFLIVDVQRAARNQDAARFKLDQHALRLRSD
jgi:hypothetical protein